MVRIWDNLNHSKPILMKSYEIQYTLTRAVSTTRGQPRLISFLTCDCNGVESQFFSFPIGNWTTSRTGKDAVKNVNLCWDNSLNNRIAWWGRWSWTLGDGRQGYALRQAQWREPAAEKTKWAAANRRSRRFFDTSQKWGSMMFGNMMNCISCFQTNPNMNSILYMCMYTQHIMCL